MNEERAQQVLARQLDLTKRSWQLLQQHGVTEESELRLDFFYVAPDEPEAERLGAFVQEQTDYEVRVESSRDGILRKKRWDVAGRTQPTKVTLDILNEWVAWMVAAGLKYDCEFDGWGAMAT